jgi:hypothetical protein
LKKVSIAIVISVASVLIWKLTFIHFLILLLELYLLIYFLERIGSKFVFLELLALIAVTQWLFAPMLAERTAFEMPISFKEYYSYALPATLAYVGGITIPLWKQRKFDGKVQQIMLRLKYYLKDKSNWGIFLLAIGIPCWMLFNKVSSSIGFVMYLLAQLMMIGICILLFSGNKFKWLWIGGGIAIIFITTFLNGMVGIIIFWIFIVWVIYSCIYPKRIPILFKLLVLAIGLWVMIILQISKAEYRSKTWAIATEDSGGGRKESVQDPALFYGLIQEKITRPYEYLRVENIMPFVMRLNQGYLVSYGMDHVPDRRDYGNGEVTIKYSIVAFVPRILWKDKPVVGQADYFKKYTGIKLGKSTSSTLGALGDAYVDFGKGGIVFLGFLGLAISMLFSFWINKSYFDPAFFMWIVIVYYTTLSISEISFAGFINTIFKYLIFIVFIRFFLRTILKIRV